MGKQKKLHTKIALCFCLALILICNSFLVSCDKKSENDATGETKDPGVKLTLDNYDDYIELDGSVKVGGTTRCYYNNEWVNLYFYLKCSMSASGNSNYEYKDVVIGVRFYHIQPIEKNTVSEKIVYIDLNLAGNGDGYCELETPVNQVEYDEITSIMYTFYSTRGIDSALSSTYFEVVSVEGTVCKN